MKENNKMFSTLPIPGGCPRAKFLRRQGGHGGGERRIISENRVGKDGSSGSGWWWRFFFLLNFCAALKIQTNIYNKITLLTIKMISAQANKADYYTQNKARKRDRKCNEISISIKLFYNLKAKVNSFW